jgi:RNAse (barnase) inhibitor barstar
MHHMRRTYVIDGERFATLEEFYDEISRVLIPDACWGRNLDAFNDILRGGFGTPEEGFILRWQHDQRITDRLERGARPPSDADRLPAGSSGNGLARTPAQFLARRYPRPIGRSLS